MRKAFLLCKKVGLIVSTPFLGCKNLHVQFYGRDEVTLNGVTLSIDEGETVLFLGPSGCGKSTLLHALAGIIPRSIDAFTKGDVWHPERVGTLFQDPESQFCMLQIGDEIAFSLENRRIAPAEMPARIERAKRAVHLDDYPNDTLLQSLSGGLKQRLALACVLALEPEVLFLDEPTAQLDPSATKQVLSCIRELKNEHTIVLIEHKLDGVMDWVDRTVLFSPDGHMIDDGTPQAVLQRNEAKIKQYGIWTPRLWPLKWEAVTSGQHPEQVAAWRPLRQRKRTSEPVSETSLGTEQQTRSPLVKVTDATLRYGKKRPPVWRDVNLTVARGDWVAVLGANGSGKSTFLKVLMGLLPLSSGNISYRFPEPLKSKKTESLSQQIGFVFQNPEHQFITDRVYDEIAYIGTVENWPARELHAKTEQLLDDFHLSTWQEVNPYTLSVGQKRRLSVASMLLKQYPLLLLDEPTFGQDAATTAELLVRLQQLHAQGTTIAMATHDVELAYRYATRAVVFGRGKLLFDGPPDDLFHDRQLLTEAKLDEPMYVQYLRRRAQVRVGVI